MSFFKKLFGTKESPIAETSKVPVDNNTNSVDKPTVSATSSPDDTRQNSEIIVEGSSVSRITGFDEDFINIIYFPDEISKQKYRDKINAALSHLKIEFGAEFLKVHEKLNDYNNIELEEPIPFLIDSLLIETFNIRKDSNGVTETKSPIVNKGLDKVQGYYPATSFISSSTSLKLNFHQTDFSFEEDLYSKHVLTSELRNFANLNATFSLGHAYFAVNSISKAESYFDLIENGTFELQPSTISNYYRTIGELYADIGDRPKAIKWLKSGLTLNPKLGVKKLITKLETDK
jgi:tetratricopeptide (TPR) repeat protein